MISARNAILTVAICIAVMLSGLVLLWWRRRHRSWVKDDDLMDLAESLNNPRTRMPVEPKAEDRANGALVRIPNWHKEV